MLSVILSILKILGIILLVILGILFALVLIVLFVPIRYWSKGYVENTVAGIDDEISVKVTWLLHIVSLRYDLKGKDGDLTIRIFGKRLNLSKKENDEKKTGV